jgi:hypothetical protein
VEPYIASPRGIFDLRNRWYKYETENCYILYTSKTINVIEQGIKIRAVENKYRMLAVKEQRIE